MRVIVTGASGQLGGYVLERLGSTPWQVHAWSGRNSGDRFGYRTEPIDLADLTHLVALLEKTAPDAVIHLAAISKPDTVLRDFAHAQRINVDATRTIADWCHQNGARLIFTSTDLVFDGARGHYQEHDTPNPRTRYGQTKQAAETAVLATPQGLVARMSLMYGPSRLAVPSYFDTSLAALQRGESRAFFRDEFRTPLDYASAADALVQLLESSAIGIVHVGGPDRLSRAELMTRVARALGCQANLIELNSIHDSTSPEPRAADVSLDTTRLMTLLPGLTRLDPEAATRSWRLDRCR